MVKIKFGRAEKFQVTKHMRWPARTILCLPRGSLEMAITYLTLRADLQRKDAHVHKKGLQERFAETAETERQRWCTNPPTKKRKNSNEGGGEDGERVGAAPMSSKTDHGERDCTIEKSCVEPT
jgi:hypothetical protein